MGCALDAAVVSYEAKVADLAQETLRTSAVAQFCRENNNRPGRGPVGEAGLGWNAALTAVQRLLNDAIDPAEPLDGADREALP